MKSEPLVESLLRPEAYPQGVAEVEHLRTHISDLFFAGDRVYKIKRPVDLGFLDYSTAEIRERFCRLEVELNRRLAGDVYLGVVEITQTPDGELEIGGGGEVVEHAVEMRRLPARRMLDALLPRGELDNEMIERVAATLSRFHAGAATGAEVDTFGAPEAVRANVLGNFSRLRSLADPVGLPESVLSPVVLDHLQRFLENFLDAQRDLLARRVTEGRIRDGHGDLHAGNICFLEDRVVAYDCIEFAPALRCCDVAGDVAFLAMDLDFRGFRGASRYFLNSYARQAEDPELAALVPFYKAHYACVRAMVALMRADREGRDTEEGVAAAEQGARYLHLAASYSLPPALLLSCGLPATGKSYVGRQLADLLGAAFLQSDVTRKRLAGKAPRDHTAEGFDQGIYQPEFTLRTYDELARRTSELLDSRRTVVVDATFSSRSRRGQFKEIALRHRVPFLLVHCVAPEEVIRERMERRKLDPEEPSDADIEVYLKARTRFEEPDELPPQQVVLCNSPEPLSRTTGHVLERLLSPLRGQ